MTDLFHAKARTLINVNPITTVINVANQSKERKTFALLYKKRKMNSSIKRYMKFFFF